MLFYAKQSNIYSILNVSTSVFATKWNIFVLFVTYKYLPSITKIRIFFKCAAMNLYNWFSFMHVNEVDKCAYFVANGGLKIILCVCKKNISPKKEIIREKRVIHYFDSERLISEFVGVKDKIYDH